MHKCPHINVLTIAMHKCINVRTKPDVGGGETETMENLLQPSHAFKCRKVIMHKCPCINVLRL